MRLGYSLTLGERGCVKKVLRIAPGMCDEKSRS